MQQNLARLFGIEIGFRAELSNHIHLILRTRPDVVETWSDQEVVRRWLVASKLAKSSDGCIREPLRARVAMEMAIPGRIQELRTRLSDPSWFMATLCEYISRRGNREDDCRGAFFEDRYKCRELIDEGSILVCGIYVDLNQIRAGEAQSPETSTHTSAYDRIQSRQERLSAASQADTEQELSSQVPDGWLCELTLDERAAVDGPGMLQSATQRRASDKGLIPVSLDDYLQLLTASGRITQAGKSGTIPQHLAPILERLGIRSHMWTDLVTGFDQMFGRVVGASEKVADRAAQAGRHWYRGIANCAAAFG